LDQDKPESSDCTPFTFIAAAGNEVVVTDEWVEQSGGTLSEATVTDKVTDVEHRFVLIEAGDDHPIMRWLRRVNETCYVATDIYAPMDYVPDDPDEHLEEWCETIDNAEMELVMAVGLFPRYNIEAEWMDQSRRDYLTKLQSQVDDAASEDVEAKRHGLLGISELF